MLDEKRIKKLWRQLPAHVRDPDPTRFESDNYTVVDFETTTLDYGSPHNPDNKLLCASWLNGPDHPRPGQHEKWGSEFEMAELVQDIRDAHYFVAHNAKFEAGWLERCGMDLAEMIHACTMLAEKCIAGNRPWRFSLDDTLGRHGLGSKDKVGQLIRLGVDTLSIRPDWLMRYCGKDVRQTEKLWLRQRETMCMDGLLPVFYTRNILTPVLYDIEHHGLKLDAQRATKVWEWHEAEEAKLAKQFEDLSGGVNPKSTPQKQKLLYHDLKLPYPTDDMGRYMLTAGKRSKKLPKLKEGQETWSCFATDAAAIAHLKEVVAAAPEKYAHAGRVLGALTALSSIRDARSKLVDKMYECATTEGVLYGEFHQTRAGTHRLASSGRSYKTQLQNFPRRFRPLIVARNDGWVIGDGDSAGIEFRTAVDLAKDPNGIADIENDVDIHALTASIIFAGLWDTAMGPKEGGNAACRQGAKAYTFKPLYGGNTGTPEQCAYFEAFRERYSAVAEMQKGWTHHVLKHGWLRTASGLKFYWPDCTMSESGYIKYTTNIYDYPVQMLATADMVPTATVYLWHFMRLCRMESFLVCVVHDSAVGELHPAEVEDWSWLLQYCFNKLIIWYLKEVYEYEWVTPLGSEVSAFPHWTDKDPAKWDAQWEVEETAEPKSFKDLEDFETWDEDAA